MPAQRYSIVGSNFAPGATVALKRMQGGEELKLVREPDNKHDKNAIAVYCGTQRLGFVPKTHNVTLAAFIDSHGDRVADVEVFAQDSASGRNNFITARFVRSPNSAFPQAEVV